VVGAPIELRAVLPPPPSINATYRSGRGVWYKSVRARAWEEEALLLLRAAGFQAQPLGSYWIGVELTLWTCRLDLDAPIKLVLDTVEEALGINDRWVGRLTVTKLLADHLADQRLELRCEARSIAGKQDFNALSERTGLASS